MFGVYILPALDVCRDSAVSQIYDNHSVSCLLSLSLSMVSRFSYPETESSSHLVLGRMRPFGCFAMKAGDALHNQLG